MSSSSSSSESDDELQSRLKESVAGVNIASWKESEDLRKKKTEKKSMRSVEDDKSVTNVLATTPEFQNFVAKKLTSYMESIIVDEICDNDQTTHSITNEDGIRLLKKSTIFLPDIEYEEKSAKEKCDQNKKKASKRKKKRQSSSSSSEDEQEMERLRQAAVPFEVSSAFEDGEEGKRENAKKKNKAKKKKKKKRDEEKLET